MQYIETTIEQLSALGSGVEIVQSPDESGVACLKIGDKFFLPFIGWMKYETTDDHWREIEPEEEEAMVNTLSEVFMFREVSDREAGEKFSNDIELID